MKSEIIKKEKHKRVFLCLSCWDDFQSKKFCKNRTPKYCSKECYAKRQITEDWLEKLSKAKIWKDPWNKWIKMWEWKIHPKGTLWMKGLWKWKIISQETRARISEANRWRKCPDISGEKSHFWKWWITLENEKIRKSADYRFWRTSVFKRDNFLCVHCGAHSKNLHVDHIKPFSLFPELRFVMDNWRTLCVDCHRKTDTYWSKILKYATANA